MHSAHVQWQTFSVLLQSKHIRVPGWVGTGGKGGQGGKGGKEGKGGERSMLMLH